MCNDLDKTERSESPPPAIMQELQQKLTELLQPPAEFNNIYVSLQGVNEQIKELQQSIANNIYDTPESKQLITELRNFASHASKYTEILQQSEMFSKAQFLYKKLQKLTLDLKKLGVKDGRIGEAYKLFENKIPESVPLLIAIINYAVELQETENPNLMLKDIADTIENGGRVLDSPYKEKILEILAIADNSLFCPPSQIERLLGANLTKFYAPNNKLTQEITSSAFPMGEAVALRVSKKNARPVFTDVLLSLDKSKAQLSGGTITEYDKQVYNAIVSQYVEEIEKRERVGLTFTDRTIYRALTGHNEDVNPAPETLEEIAKSIDKISSIQITIDATNEMSLYGRKDNEGNPITYMVKTHLLNINQVAVQAGGKVLHAYKLLDCPVLYQYAKLCGKGNGGQVQSYEIALRNVPNVSQTTNNIALIGYLLSRIHTIKSKKSKATPVIRLETLFTTLGINAKDRTTTKRVRDNASKCLQYWKKCELINSFEFQKEGNKIAKIAIK